MLHVLRNWLALHWVAGALFMALALLAVEPLLTSLSLPALLIYLHSPGYHCHQCPTAGAVGAAGFGLN